MQEPKTRRSNSARSEATRAALISAARALFIARGYGEVGTPELVAAAGVTRGALYHHFADKRALFVAVVEAESAAVATEIETAAPDDMAPLDALVAGGQAYLDAMQAPGRTRLLLLDAPAVLGYTECEAIDRRHANRTLRAGLDAAMVGGALRPVPLDALVAMLSAVFDRAAVAIASGDARADWDTVIAATLDGLAVR